MTTIACHRAGGLIARRASGLTEAERLILERHLSACASCGADARRLDMTRALVDDVPVGTAAQRDRVIARVLAGAAAAEVPHTRSRLPYLVLALGGALTFAAVVFAVRQDPEPLREAAIKPRVAPSVPPRSAQPPASPPPSVVVPASGVEHVVAEPSTVALAHATARFTPGSRYAWHPERATLELVSGEVRLVVDPAMHTPFRVQTPRFVVAVLGTELEVRADRVTVISGRVQILAPGGAVLDGEVTVGETWEVPLATAAVPPRPRRAEPAPTIRLRHARSLIASGDLAGARAELAAVLAAPRSPAHEAAARNLLADAARVSGDRELAIQLYLDVARAFPQQPDGEAALFEAARLELRARRPARANALLVEYLSRYPRGRFRAEALSHQSAAKETP